MYYDSVLMEHPFDREIYMNYSEYTVCHGIDNIYSDTQSDALWWKLKLDCVWLRIMKEMVCDIDGRPRFFHGETVPSPFMILD